MNIGFNEAQLQETFQCFIFHDVDFLYRKTTAIPTPVRKTEGLVKCHFPSITGTITSAEINYPIEIKLYD
jgi:hypothetical protein